MCVPTALETFFSEDFGESLTLLIAARLLHSLGNTHMYTNVRMAKESTKPLSSYPLQSRLSDVLSRCNLSGSRAPLNDPNKILYMLPITVRASREDACNDRDAFFPRRCPTASDMYATETNVNVTSRRRIRMLQRLLIETRLNVPRTLRGTSRALI